MKNNFTANTFGQNVFDYKKMRRYLPRSVYNAVKNARENGATLTDKQINVYAAALKKWALKKGVTRYTHWFQPLNNLTAEKHDSLNSLNKEGYAVIKFRGKELQRGEGDASSLPSGGMRDSYEARGVTLWDYTAFPFIKGDCLCIPTTFCGAGGETLDKKKPLIASCKALNKQALRLLKSIGMPAKQVKSVVGAEQEYFLIDKTLFDRRKDLVYTGRTLFGKMAPKGQEFDDHYFRPPSETVIKFMQDVDLELWKLGIIVKTEHNEVAPCQYELAPCYTDANCACDQNQLIMETLKNVASKHGLACLLHEKPFDKINGSGKHNNWSLLTDSDCNLLEAGNTPEQNARFLLVLSAVIKATDDYNGLLISSITSASNDLRLGGYEAPPKILTVYLGEKFTDVIKEIISTDWQFGKDTLPKDIYGADRNRTSPLAFCGNKFEFRMVGSSACIADVNTVLNTVIAESFKIFADRLQNSQNVWSTVEEIVKDTFETHGRVIYNGNGYSGEWIGEATSRGLNYTDSDTIFCQLTDNKTVNLFESNNVLNRRELLARQTIKLETYCNTVNLESIVANEIYERQIAPAIESYLNLLSALANSKQNVNLDNTAEKEKITAITQLQSKCSETIESLKKAVTQNNAPPLYNEVTLRCKRAREYLSQLRQYVNELEQVCPKSDWPMPTYGQLLFSEK